MVNCCGCIPGERVWNFRGNGFRSHNCQLCEWRAHFPLKMKIQCKQAQVHSTTMHKYADWFNGVIYLSLGAKYICCLIIHTLDTIDNILEHIIMSVAFHVCLETSRHQSARRDRRKQKSFNIVMFDSQESRVNKSQGLEKEREETFKKLGLVAAQCNGIAACAYSLEIFTVHTLLYLTVHGL